MKHRSVLHPGGILLGAGLAAAGLALAELIVGPLLAGMIAPAEEKMLAMVHRNLLDSYVEEPDAAGLMRDGVRGMVDGLEEPYTFFVGPDAMTSLDEESSGKLIGIGIVLDTVAGIIRYPEPGGPAEAAGLLPGDRILEIDGESVTDLPLPELVARIKGPKDIQVALLVQHLDGKLLEVMIQRRPVMFGTVGRVEMLDAEAGIGRIHIRSFARSTPRELDRALDRLRDLDLRALILDLRWNTGGLLDSAVDTAARFLNGGPVCLLQVRDAPDRLRSADPEQSRFPNLPLVVLINRLSASGSEVLAGALRDRGAAILAGEPTFGKGVYQQVHRYRSGQFALKFTAGYYLTPAGHILEGHLHPSRAGGLDPDLSLPPKVANDSEVRRWLAWNDPPLMYRQQVFQLFPRLAEMKSPPDEVLDTSLQHLRVVLQTSG